MPDLSITAANVAAQGGAGFGERLAGATITAGQAITINANNRAILASDASATLAKFNGIALHASSDGQPLKYQTSGDINLGATLSVGKHYVLSTAGAISPVDDVESGDFASYVGLAISTSLLRLNPLAAPVAAAADVV